MNLGEKIIEQAAKLAPMRSKLEGLEKSLTEVTDAYTPGEDDESCIEQIEQLTKDINELRPQVEAEEARLKALRDAEKELVRKAVQKPTGAGGPVVIPHLHKGLAQDHKVGDFFVKMALVRAISHLNKQPELQVLEQLYDKDEQVRAVYGWTTKTAVMPADTTTATWAAELVQDDMVGFLDMLKTVSIGAGLASRSLTLSFGGNASITIPRMNQLGTPTEPAWVGEGGVIPLQQFSFGSATINRYKLASIIPLTMELVEQSVPQAESVMRDGMQEAYVIMLDAAILSAAAAIAGVRPAGLLNGVSVGTGDATGGYEAVVKDISTLLGALASNKLGQRPVLLVNDQDYIGVGMLMNPLGQLMFQSDVANGRLMGVDVLASSTVAQGTCIMVDASALATAFDGPQFRISQEATLTMANADGTAPTQADDGAGVIGTAGQVPPDAGIPVAGGTAGGVASTGYQAVNLFQTYSEAIRGIWPTSWTLLRPGAVAALNTLSWTS